LTDAETIGLGEGATRFLATVPAEKGEASQQEVYRFVRWQGWDVAFSRMAASQIDSYAEHVSQSDSDPARKLEPVRAFLAFAKKQGWSDTNLGTHLKARRAKGRRKATAARPAGREPVHLTQQGYGDLKAELATLLARRPGLIEDIRRAAADKDFRENAPLDAAREQRGHLEGRILEIEECLAAAVIIDDARETGHRIAIGDEFTLEDVESGDEMCCTLVGPREVDAASGKISAASPIGRAAVGKAAGEEIMVEVPAGKLRFRIVCVGTKDTG
jgi:transcription elongation factor GreA